MGLTNEHLSVAPPNRFVHCDNQIAVERERRGEERPQLEKKTKEVRKAKRRGEERNDEE